MRPERHARDDAAGDGHEPVGHGPRQVWQIRPVLSQYGIFILLAFIILAGPLLSGFMVDATRFILG